ncbi:hypothetical protein KY284_010198 [Solanum tuberosum]|nr:hypothetical protein KY284_010198 [Solanum tuberosum]
MGSVRVTAEKRTLIDPTNRMLETLRRKSEKEIGQNFTSMGSIKGSIIVQGTLIGKSKGCSTGYFDRNELASDKNLMHPCLDLIEDETSFPHENLDEMQVTARSKPAKENGQNFTYVCSSKESNAVQRMSIGKSKNYSVPSSGKNELAHNKNLMQPGFDPIEVDTIISHDDLEVMGRGKGFTSLSSVGGSVEKRKMIGNNKEKDIRQTFTSMGSVKGSIVVQGTSIGKSKDCSAAYSDRNELASDKNLVQPCLDLIEDETSFPHENLDEKRQNFTSVCSSKESKNLMQPAFDPIEVDTLISYDDLKVMGRGKRFTSLSSVRGSVEKRKMIGNNKGLNFAAYDQNVVAQKTNVVPPYFDAIECDTSFPHDNHEVMQDTLRRKFGKVNREIFTSVDSGRESTFQQRTSIRTSKGYSAVSSDTNDLRSKSARERAQSFTSISSMRRCAEKITLNGQSKDSENAEYELDELTQNNNCVLSGLDPIEDDPTLPRDEVEVMQDNQRRKTGSCEFEKVKKVRGPNLCKVVTGLKPGEKLRVTFYHNRVVGDHHALFSRHLGSLVRDRNMCPLRVHLWTDIEEANLEHMWGAVTEKFDSDDMNGHRDHVLKHMRRLWNNWRGSMHMNAKSKPLKEVLKDVPQEVDKSDWEWLVKENFLTEKFKETSTRSAGNRSKLSMPHRTGSKPIREIIYELDEIHELLQVEPSLTNIEVVERCFGPQSKSHVVGFGDGITSKDLKGGNTAKTALLEKLNASQKENVALLE